MYFDPQQFKITGTYVWYYCICKREVWLLSRGITADQQDSNVDIGRFIHERSYSRDKKEVEINGMKLDILQNNKGRLLVGEIKKSSKYLESARMQILLYLSELEKEGIKAEGVLMVPQEKKRESVLLDEVGRKQLDEAKQGIMEIVCGDFPPPPLRIYYCKSCAYSEMCWA
ncbi:MAG: CRISPR-associated protein Cas4 [Clostridiales bacterium]|jgi:CRISPR-associated exonuclease Cas4|nr:CRISPR-associated protein Cas4 [Eubacteriales bacterium]MDH7567308.1 CRISPR-associated protein Cas4 [Clostridiales bacterium]